MASARQRTRVAVPASDNVARWRAWMMASSVGWVELSVCENMYHNIVPSAIVGNKASMVATMLAWRAIVGVDSASYRKA